MRSQQPDSDSPLMKLLPADALIEGQIHAEDVSLDCHQVAALLDKYFSGALSPEEYAKMDLHLSVCQPCSAEAETYSGVIRLAASLPLLTPPPDVESRLLKLIASTLENTNPRGVTNDVKRDESNS